MLKLSRVLLLISLTSIISLLPAQAQQPLSQSQIINPGETPAGLSSTQWDSIQSQIATRRYHAYSHPGGGYTSSNLAHGWQIRYAADGTTTLRPRDDKAQSYHLGIKLSAVGYQALKPLDKPQQISTKEYTVTYHWTDHLQERWINTKKDLEQWFILDQRPEQSKAGQPLNLQMMINSDLKASQIRHSIHFDHPQGTAITYSKLKVWDARGRILASRMKLSGNTLSLIVEDASASYPLTIDPSFQQKTYLRQAYVKASNTGKDDRFGQSVAIDGNTLVVGAPGESSDSNGVNGYQSDNSASYSGAVYIFTRAGTIWSQQAYVKASNPDAGDKFGTSVAISGETIAVGAPGEASKGGVLFAQTDNSAKKSGAVYVFARTGIHWSQQAYVKASNPDAGDVFGTSVAIDGNTLVVGALGESSDATGVNGDQKNNSSQASGAAYVFERNKNSWKYQAYLKASNAGAGDLFGYSVTISDDTIVVGAIRFYSSKPGAAYLFERGTSLGFIYWSQRAYLKASNSTELDGFGTSVDIFGETVAIGAPIEGNKATGVNSDQSDDSAPNSGAAYVFALTKTSLDIDGDGKAKPLTDGLLLIRYLFGFRGDTLIDNAVDPAATRTTAVQIQPYIQAGIDSKIWDIDNDGSVKPLTDGLLVIRYLFGFKGNTLIDNAVDPTATRKTANAIEAYLLSIMP